VAPLFFLGLASLLCTFAWLFVAATIRLGGIRLAPVARKRLVMAALLMSLIVASAPTVAGILMRHTHSERGWRHHTSLCATLFLRMAGADLGANMDVPPSHVAAGLAINGALWALLGIGVVSALRMAWVTARLGPGLRSVMREPGERAVRSLERIRRRLPGLQPDAFFEADLPMHLSGLVGVIRPRCVLSAELVRTATDDELDAVIAHEAVHLGAGDVYGTLLVTVVERLFFFLRPTRLLCREWREQAEIACDTAASRITGQPLTMAAAILRTCGVAVRAADDGVVAAPPATATITTAASRRVESLIALAEPSARTMRPASRGAVFASWSVTLGTAALGLGLLASAQVACYAHCAMEVVARALP
jgi:Zn-dependent protease with chaperone function